MAVPKARDVKLTAGREKAVLVGGYRPGDLLSGEEPLEELQRLAETAGAEVVGTVVQHLRQFNPATYIGKGKVEEVKELALERGAKCILFDHDLLPSQGRNLDQATALKVMDRTELILDIFASRARTRMAMVQVSIALFEYRLPRLKRLWTHLERQTGGIGLRGGPGERQLEVDRRKIEKHLYDLRNELREMEARKERMVRARARDHFLVSLVGYTNAGKSTLMKALTGEDVFIEDRLFATLDTKTSLLKLGGGLHALLSDTVGFLRRLPHHLVASFHATLEEARTADLLLHVADASSPLVRGQIDAVQGVLREIGAANRETLLVLNKVDAIPPALELDHRMLRRDFPEAISRERPAVDRGRARRRWRDAVVPGHAFLRRLADGGRGVAHDQGPRLTQCARKAARRRRVGTDSRRRARAQRGIGPDPPAIPR
ncbi:MAG: GTPase HflX [Planctomycetota bacterium]|nr:GTPase HflX [Planctomycetota bacterium]